MTQYDDGKRNVGTKEVGYSILQILGLTGGSTVIPGGPLDARRGRTGLAGLSD